ncbi:S8 family serine peptidase [Tropicibacter sp. Alg240-R139]|uniref:S8 family serine peptidase n=1 Tax=Tropicibacter sp. Alg240-R139 TaxID=2305991 RepID=UPI0013E07754|nr:S8 family serine peptidase [Tropicibacter sp. Alg240-R139]
MPQLTRYFHILWIILLGVLVVWAVAASADTAEDLALEASEEICLVGLNTPPVEGARQLATFDERAVNRPHMRSRDWETPDGFLLRVSEFAPPERPPLFFAAVYGKPPHRAAIIRLVRDSKCHLRGGERVETAQSDAAPAPQRLARLNDALEHRERPIPLNPKLPKTIRDNHRCLPVALIDNGVNYLIPAIADRLAAHDSGQLVGFDFWENDPWPFDFGVPDGDLDPRVSAFEPISHGTSVASVFLNDAADAICLAPFRYAPHKRNQRIGQVIDQISASGVRVIFMSTGRSRPWPEYQASIAKHPQILFISAAGNEGVDLTQQPLFPMAYTMDNHLVVAAANNDGTLWGRTNTGADVVEVAVPAIEVAGVTFSGKPKLLTGTSFAAPRVAALAGQLALTAPDADGAGLKQLILSGISELGQTRDGINTISLDGLQALLDRSRPPSD